MQPIAELPFIAGHVALDFVNTAEERGHPDAGDALQTADDLRIWGRRHGVLTGEVHEQGDAGELRRALTARELLYRLFLDRVRGTRSVQSDVDRLADLAVSAYEAGHLEMDAAGGLVWRWSASELDSVRHVAVTSAIELLATAPPSRLKQCPGEHCGWFFIDVTKRGNRRWCSMSECGQDAKSARRRTRAKQPPDAAPGPPDRRKL